uniref:Uncharacterized protein n=1 Tax=Candidatus Kentrum sp. MB TaxID=2138164 RepID=A0A451BGT2_9GAMM|nr:MAG: hypothetical protein BECKMB1821G_GA0114241_11255 [Candidatus Kentron sp. MB]VFK35788.1 MAG: hypothetical protein BECKMB1821I_GA0114274_11462 [Candidatus Kentron sp. MB]VFK77491.1 MAG: hypothetical protein BECKMB1821H_GA0114242_11473 [Candidatus Kentron sp. MB]
MTTTQFLSCKAEGLVGILRKSLKWVPLYEMEERLWLFEHF